MNNMEWISVEDRLPEIPNDSPSWSQQIKVIGYWLNGTNHQWAEFYYVKRTVRGKEVKRFEWQGRINTFPISHWAIPEPPNK